MSDYEIIPRSYRFGRIYDHLAKQYIPAELVQIIDWLHFAHGLNVEGIYLENYKAPVYVICLDGVLPIREVASRFASARGVSFHEAAISADKSCTLIVGTGAD